MQNNTRTRNWVFTLNCPNGISALEEDMLLDLPEKEGSFITFLIFGREKAPSTGTPHLQGYLEVSESMNLLRLKNHIVKLTGRDEFNRIHLEPRRGTQEQAVEYCKKDGDWEMAGVPARPQGRPSTRPGGGDNHARGPVNRALPFLDLIKQGRIEEIASDPEVSHNVLKHCLELAKLFEQGRNPAEPVEVRWYWGPTGTGKTRRAMWEAEQLDMGAVYVKATNSKWFDGYDGHKVVIFDDLRSTWFEFSYLLKLLDRYPVQVECKGGSRQFKATKIFVTSPFPPREMYRTMQQTDDGKYDLIDQLVRRVTHVEHMPGGPLFNSWEPPQQEQEEEAVSQTQIVPHPDSGEESSTPLFCGTLTPLPNFTTDSKPY